LKARYKAREYEGDTVSSYWIIKQEKAREKLSSYWMPSRKQEDTGISKRKP
jgi:hypothetical protein